MGVCPMRLDEEHTVNVEKSDSKDSGAATAYRLGGARIDEHNAKDVLGAAVFSSDSRFIGEAWQVYLADDSKWPEWLTVRTSLFRSTEHVVPLAGATMSSEGVWVSYDKHTVKNAPRVSADQGHMSQTQKAALHRHYGLGDGRRP